MHPVTKTKFGPDGIQVLFSDGTSVVPGYIVKQTGTSRFIVTADGVHTFVATLATTLAEATALAAGQMTILVGDDAEHISSLYDMTCQTLEGHRLSWTLGVSVNGSSVIQSGAAPVWTTTTTTLPPVTGGSSYSETLTVTSLLQPVTFRLASGLIPSGLHLSPTGVLSGTATNPAVTWTTHLEIVAANSVASESKTFSLTVNNTPVIPII